MDSAPHLVEDFQGLLQVYSDDGGVPHQRKPPDSLLLSWRRLLRRLSHVANCHNCCLRLAFWAWRTRGCTGLPPGPRAQAAGGGGGCSELTQVATRSSCMEDCEEWLSEGVDLDRGLRSGRLVWREHGAPGGSSDGGRFARTGANSGTRFLC
ncbi:hypothetical protein CK203_029772 [Vitis vinifera]|uniref:Uncharacterized protein n=1 Tax=Vitis vinifera TaxID=29760 RepID=A0A438II59_VITVI|nr:hypothetical protein CK203_029772 [Vitis vinifera]